MFSIYAYAYMYVCMYVRTHIHIYRYLKKAEYGNKKKHIQDLTAEGSKRHGKSVRAYLSSR